MGEKMKLTNSNERLFAFIWNVLAPFWKSILGQVLTIVIVALDTSLRPYTLKIVLDKIAMLTSENTQITGLGKPICYYLGMSLLINITFRVYDYCVYRRNPEIKRVIINQMLTKLMKFSSEFFQNNLPGSLASKIDDVANGVPQILSIVIDRFFGQILGLGIAIYTAASVDSYFALFLIGWVAIILLTTVPCIEKIKAISVGVAANWTEVTGQIVDSLSNISSVRFFVGDEFEKQKTNSYLNQAVTSEQSFFRYTIRVYAALGIVFIILQSLCLLLLIQGIKSGRVSVGDFYLIVALNISISDQLFFISHDIAQFSEQAGKVIQGFEVVSNPQEIKDLPTAKELVVNKGEIIFEDITFCYKNTNPLFFNNKKIIIKAGEKIGLIGQSGSGKSTFVNLILRIFELQGGRILIDGQNISEVTQSSLRNAIAIVPQDIPLFHRTLLENIRYGKQNASDQEVVAAAQKAHAHDFIMATASGYATVVGDRGSKLSGGQRQRIAIARAALKNAPILIFDEATSALDSITEGLIQDSLWELMQGRTTIIIAHKLTTLQWMDRILVFDKGQIIEEGTHDELLVKSSAYKEMWEAQVGSFLPKNDTDATLLADEEMVLKDDKEENNEEGSQDN